jgi:hypothetical protein
MVAVTQRGHTRKVLKIQGVASTIVARISVSGSLPAPRTRRTVLDVTAWSMAIPRRVMSRRRANGRARRDAAHLRSAGSITRFAGACCVGALIACGGAEPAPADEPASLQAVLSIERVEDVSHVETSSASAMAQFVVLPADADPHQTLDAAGLRPQLPERRGCADAAVDGALLASDGQAFPEQLELLEAGDVSIRADGTLTRLALNLFPPSGSASGVIYTTPDQSAPLPPGASYAIVATGSEAIPPLSIQQDAPSALRDVTVGGVPLERAVALVAGQPVDVTWSVGDAADRVFVELAGVDYSVFCSFADEDGSGSVPGALIAKLGTEPVRLAIHRVRENVRAQEPPRADALVLETRVRFDFELTTTLRID